MPPRKKSIPGTSMSGAEPPKKRAKTVHIDYTVLAAEIIRQQNDEPGPSGANIQVQDNNTDLQVTVEPPPSHNTELEQTPVDHSCTPMHSNVQTIVDEIFSGEPSSQVGRYAPQIKVSDGIPLGATIPQKVKEKIWGDEFIDMNVLSPHYECDPFSLLITNKKFSIINNNNRNKMPLSISQWTTAFFVFMDIYIEKRPEEARQLLKYGHNIREMHDLYGDEPWRLYDERFRRLRESVQLSWGKIVDELYTKAANACNNPHNHSFRPQSSFRPSHYNSTLNKYRTDTQTTAGFQPTLLQKVKTCIFFNRGQPCRKPCPYKHICHFCKGPHARYQCSEYKAQAIQGPNNQNTQKHLNVTTGTKSFTNTSKR